MPKKHCDSGNFRANDGTGAKLGRNNFSPPVLPASTYKMADDLEVLRQEIKRKSLELESLKNLLAVKVSTAELL